jgi:hypothetical protein
MSLQSQHDLRKFRLPGTKVLSDREVHTTSKGFEEQVAKEVRECQFFKE